MLRSLITLQLALHVVVADAQNHGRIINYSVADGLESYSADFAMQDKYGFIWISQSTSLARFDGYVFKNYRHQPNDSLLQLGPQTLGRLHLDERGELWVNNITYNGNGFLLKYDYERDGFIKFKPKLNADLRSLAVENDSIIWLGTRGQGMFRFNLNNHQITNHRNPFNKKPLKFQADYIFNIHYRSGWLYLFTGQGIWKFNPINKQFSRPDLNPADTSMIHNNALFQADFRKDSVFQLNTSYALVLDSSYNIVKKYELPKEYKESPVFNIFELDADEKLWYVTENGLNLFDVKKKTNALISESFGWTNTTMIDRDNNIWMFGLELGVKKFVRAEIQYLETKIPDKQNSAPVIAGVIGSGEKEFSILAGGNQAFDADLFVSNINGSVINVRPLNIPLQNSLGSNFYIPSLGRQRIWIGSWAGGVYGFSYDQEKVAIKTNNIITYIHQQDNPYSILSNSSPVAIEDTINNALWVGSTEGLSRIDLNKTYGEEGSVQRFVHDPGNSNSISNGIIRSIKIEEDGSLWICTDSGLDFFSHGQFKHIITNQGVTSIHRLKNGEFLALGDKIFSINKKKEVTVKLDYRVRKLVEDNDGKLWLLNEKGLSQFDPVHKIRADFSSEFGNITGMAISSKGIIQLTKNPNLLITFDPSTFQVSSKEVTPLLTTLLVNNLPVKIENDSSALEDSYLIPKSIVDLDELTLDYRHNNFSLEYSAMEMTAPEKNLYRHKLEGYDEDWIETDYKNRTATYTNLDAGTYTFRVKASNHHGVWSDQERKLSVIILPPPWRTWWAYTGYGLLVAGLLSLARRSIMQRERLKSNLRIAKVEQEKEHFELEKAKEDDKVKTSFFTNISHEFRTPLTLIKGPVQNMIDQFMNNQKEIDRRKLLEQLKLIQRNSDLLLKLINQLLDLAKLEIGNLKVENSEGDIYSFIRAVSSSFSSFASQKNISIDTTLPGHGYIAFFDKDKVETILINLINNAIKFTPSGGNVSVNAEINNSQLALSVTDTGIGIPEDHQSLIFERFHQVSEAHKEVGTGIGLALVKELIALMGGSVSLRSEAGKGSEFKVLLPIEVRRQIAEAVGTESPIPRQTLTTPKEPTLDSTANDEPAASRPHVLVVEDNADLRAFIIDSLGTQFHFLEAENGVQGFHIATSEVPDLIISDVMMPEMDGITMAGKIKGDIRSSHIPLILLTAKSTDESKLSGLSSGADDYLTKPFNKSELLLKVRNGIATRLKMREKLRSELMSQVPDVQVLSADEQFMVKVKEAILNRLSDEQLSVESLAEEIGLSRVQLYRKITALTGLAVNEIIRKLRLQKASQLLGQNWGPVSQVAYEVGFSNLSYFSKVFKEEFGVLPSEYGVKTV